MRKQLSPRQRQVLIYAARGHTARGTARALGISPSMIATHMELAQMKLQAQSIAQAVAHALIEGQISAADILAPDEPAPCLR